MSPSKKSVGKKKFAKKKTADRTKANTKVPAADYEIFERMVLRLYVTGTTPQSTRAIINLKRICEEHLAGRYDLEVIDVYQKPELARLQQIIAAPTLVKTLPLPIRRLIGDMSDEGKVLLGLSVEPSPDAKAKTLKKSSDGST